MKGAILALSCALVLAGCASPGGGSQAGTGALQLIVLDDVVGARITLNGAFLHSDGGWVEALPNGTAIALKGTGGNASAVGDVPAGNYDRLRLLFNTVTFANRSAILVENGVELFFAINITAKGTSSVTLGFSWADSLFESKDGLAFEPVVDRLSASEDGVETLRLDAQGIETGSTKAPVARIRVFDSTGLEAFLSSFVAESPEALVIANPGLLTLSATPSAAVQPAATLDTFRWEIGNTLLHGANVEYDTGIMGGNLTVRLTVKDTAGGQDSQTIRIAVKPGFASVFENFTGTVSGAESARVTQQGQSTGTVVDAVAPPKNHPFAVNESIEGVPARLTRISVSLTPGNTQPTHDLTLRLFNTTAQVAVATGAGSTHSINFLVKPGLHPPGMWKAQVAAQYGANVPYTVVVNQVWQLNPEMADFLASYSDGHSHEH